MAVIYIPSPTLELNCPLVKHSSPTIEPSTEPSIEPSTKPIYIAVSKTVFKG